MKLLNEEQKDYLRTLESHKKRRVFVVDCIIENSTKENEKLEEINRLNSQYPNSSTAITSELNNQVKTILKNDETVFFKKEYTQEDMKRCFELSRELKLLIGFKFDTFEDVLKQIENE